MEVLIYVADDIQSLADQKTLMVGVYTDRVLVVHLPKDAPEIASQETPIGIPSLSVMFTVIGLEPGEHQGQPKLLYPDGSLSPGDLQPFKFSVAPGGAANLLFKFAPFIMPQAGKYTVAVAVDDVPLEAFFEVRFNKA